MRCTRRAVVGPHLVVAPLLTLLLAVTAPARADVCDGISPVAGTELTTVAVATGLDLPVLITAPPGDVERIFIVEQDGVVRLLKNGTLLPTPFLDIQTLVLSPADMGGNEEGLLGLAFHPDYDANGFFFVYYTNLNSNNLVARYQRSAENPDLADEASGQSIIGFPHPGRSNHNGGMLAFGPNDGFLYIGTGDGGGGCDPSDNAQDGSSNLGKLLRIDVNTFPFVVPADNPFVGDAAVNDEIWALGLRNPWRYSFDRLTGDLYIGDVGQSVWEEVDWQAGDSPGGENYGWDVFEGSACPNPSCAPGPTCTVPGHVPPILEYSHASGGCSVTGGYVYRGCRSPDLHGTYLYADYCADFIKSFRVVGGTLTDPDDWTTRLDPPGAANINSITSFGEDARGELYILDRGGQAWKVVPVLSAMEVSGNGAERFRPGPDDWTWEDLEMTSMHPISTYRVYRHDGNGSGPFDCVFQGPTPVWPGGDPMDPAPDTVFSYVVTATNSFGDETSPGKASDGTPRPLSAVACP